jgi:hypothetical protein
MVSQAFAFRNSTTCTAHYAEAFSKEGLMAARERKDPKEKARDEVGGCAS